MKKKVWRVKMEYETLSKQDLEELEDIIEERDRYKDIILELIREIAKLKVKHGEVDYDKEEYSENEYIEIEVIKEQVAEVKQVVIPASDNKKEFKVRIDCVLSAENFEQIEAFIKSVIITDKIAIKQL